VSLPSSADSSSRLVSCCSNPPSPAGCRPPFTSPGSQPINQLLAAGARLMSGDSDSTGAARPCSPEQEGFEVGLVEFRSGCCATGPVGSGHEDETDLLARAVGEP
jgi:hypothetical protein